MNRFNIKKFKTSEFIERIIELNSINTNAIMNYIGIE